MGQNCKCYYGLSNSHSRCLRQPSLTILIQVASLALVVCQSAAMRHSQRNDAITSLELIASINVGAMAYFAHIYAAQSSGLLANYLLFTSFVDFYKSRIHLLQPELALVASFGFAAACLRLALLLLEELPKNGPPSADEQASKNTEPNRGWFCRSVFIYLDPSFITNLCDRLRNQDSAELSPQLSSAVLQKTVRERWTRLESKRYRHRLIIACISAWRWEISALCLLFLTTALFSAAPAFFIEQIVRFVERDQVPARSLLLLGMQLDLSCMALFVYFGMHVAQSIRSYLQSDLLLKVRGGLMGMVMEKTHRLTAKDAQTSGDTRINTEIELGCEKLSFFLRESVALFDLIIGLSGLFWRIGTPSIGILCAILLTHLLGRRLLALRQVIHLQCEEIKRARISKTLEVLKQLPGLKLLGLGPTVREHLHRLRLKELEASKPYYIYSALFFAVQVFSQHIVTIVTVTFMYFWGESDERMATAQFFPILSIIQILTLDIPRTIHLQGFALDIFFHFEHVQRFLLLSERQEFRKTLSYSGASDDQSTKTPMRGSEGRKVVVKFENATFGPVGKETPVLSNVNFSLLEGSISAAVGQTGCGKSTLFHGILGETKMTSGRLYANKRGIAFCSTQVWLQNVSIRENILGGLPFDAVRYQAALQSCQLNDDLAQLPGGDGFKVGPDGLNLSGGQRQKVSLARGVFLQCEVTILDDVFSSLDHRTALTILNALCGENGLLRRPQSTVLLAGHLPEILDIVDQVLVFDGQGNVSLDSVEFRKPGRRQSMVDLLASGPICVSEARESKEKAAIRRAMALHPGQGAQLENYVYLERSGSIKRMSTFFSYMGKLGCITVVIFAILVASSEDAVFLSLQMWARDPFGNCFWYIGIVLSTLVASFALFVSNWFLWCKFGVDTGMRLHDDVLDIAMRATYGHITSVDTTSFISWFDQHSHVVSHFLPGSFFRVFNMGYSALSTSIITTCFCSNYLLATMPFFCYTVHYVYRLHSRISEHIAGHDSRHKGLLDTFFKETSHGILHMRAFGSQDKNMMQGYQLVDKSQDALRLSPYLPMWLGLVTGLFTTTIALLLVSVIVWGGGSVSAATAAQSFLLLKNIQRTCIESIMAWSRWSTRSTVLLQLEDLRSATPQELNPSSSPELPPSWPLGDVELSNVSARYRYVILLLMYSKNALTK